MNWIRFAILNLLLIGPARLVVSQELIFEGDSAILTSCENNPPDIDSHVIYNVSDHDIALRWERVQQNLPEESFYLMIFNGIQYPPWVHQGLQFVDAYDSTNIIFQFWHKNLIPGDSAIVRMLVYDEADSLNTVHYQTAIQYCPLQTNAAEVLMEPHLSVYPNPMQGEAVVFIPSSHKSSELILYSSIGKIVREIPVANSEIRFRRDGLPNGIYILALLQDGRLINRIKVAITDQ